jgi:RNA polymerase sigma-70 factor (ECF subfamily)
MEGVFATDPDRTTVERAARGENGAWQELVAQYRDRLRRMVVLRIDPRLQGRVDPSDVLQDVFLEATGQLRDYLQKSTLPFYLWLRLKTGDRVQRLHRFHLKTKSRDVSREVSLFHGHLPEASTTALAEHLLGSDGEVVHDAIRLEQLALVRNSLQQLDELDREVLVLRHFEQLETQDVALVLGISTMAAAKRYFRALARLKTVLNELPGGGEGLLP